MAPHPTPATEDRSGPDSASIDSGADAELPRCVECGRELVDVESDGDAAPICEDCVPETGPGSPYVDRLSINLRQLRVSAGLERDELESRAAAHYVSSLEGDDAHNLRLTTALRLAYSLRASIEQLTDRIYWTPGQIVHGSEHPPAERLSGFFQVLPGNESPFESLPPRDPVAGRQEAAAIFGANVSEARERRHLTQAQLARRAGLSKNGLSLVERGSTETSVKLLLALARSLEVPPDFLLGGIAWSPISQPPGLGRPGVAATLRSGAFGMRARWHVRSPRRLVSRPERSGRRFIDCVSVASPLATVALVASV
jgi:transcriptional regulator with XRE-family HTH domain